MAHEELIADTLVDYLIGHLEDNLGDILADAESGVYEDVRAAIGEKGGFPIDEQMLIKLITGTLSQEMPRIMEGFMTEFASRMEDRFDDGRSLR